MPFISGMKTPCNCTSGNLDSSTSIFSIRPAEPGKLPLQALRTLYETAFPHEERRPWSLQEIYIREQVLHTLLLEFNQSFAGFAFFWALPGFSFIEHMAVSADLRGRGAGSTILRYMEQRFENIVLEAEPASKSADAARRIQFYQRLGYLPFADDYLQPSYHPAFPPQPMLLLYKQRSNLPSNEKVVSGIYQHVYQASFPL